MQIAQSPWRSVAAEDEAAENLELFARIFLVFFFQAEGGGVDAEAEAGGLRAVIENVSQVSVATTAENFGANHAVSHVAFHFYIVGSDRLVIAWPARAGVKFRVGSEKGLAATDAEVGSGSFGVFIFSGKRRLGTLAPGDVVLLFGEFGLPFSIILANFVGHGLRRSLES